MAEFKSFFKTVQSGEGVRCKYPTRLDTFGCGCAHNCAYCYARSLLSFRGMWRPESPAVANISKVRRMIERKLLPGDVVRLGGMTDCFQPAEIKERITYWTIKALNNMRVGYLIVTKSDIIARPEYLAILDPELAHVQISVTSTNDKISRAIEPGAPLPGRRMKAAERLQEIGIDTAVRLSPYVPEFVDPKVIEGIRCDKLQVEFLRVNGWIERWLADTGVSVDLSAYSLKEGGYKHLPIETKKALLEKFGGGGHIISVCEDVDEHYEYWRDKFNPNPADCCNLRG